MAITGKHLWLLDSLWYSKNCGYSFRNVGRQRISKANTEYRLFSVFCILIQYYSNSKYKFVKFIFILLLFNLVLSITMESSSLYKKKNQRCHHRIARKIVFQLGLILFVFCNTMRLRWVGISALKIFKNLTRNWKIITKNFFFPFFDLCGDVFCYKKI